MKRTIIAAALIGGMASVSAQSGPPTDVSTRARNAQRVVVGRILDVHSHFQTNRFGDRLIVSNAFIEVSETLKGAAATLVQLTVEGGTVGDLTLKVSDMPALNAGERGVFFMDGGEGGTHIPHDRGRGVMKLTDADRVEGTAFALEDIRQQVREGIGRGAR